MQFFAMSHSDPTDKTEDIFPGSATDGQKRETCTCQKRSGKYHKERKEGVLFLFRNFLTLFYLFPKQHKQIKSNRNKTISCLYFHRIQFISETESKRQEKQNLSTKQDLLLFLINSDIDCRYILFLSFLSFPSQWPGDAT